MANIAGDCAAIIPETMLIEFQEAKTVGASTNLYKERADWLDQQISKLVLGQTATTDSVTGGLGSGKEHRQVQEDIERADAKTLSAIINAQLIVPWIMLEFGPQKAYPRLKIGRAEEADVKLTVESVRSLVPLGLKVGQKQMREVIGLGAPADDDELLAVASAAQPDDADKQPVPADGGKGALPPGLKAAASRKALHQALRRRPMLPEELIGEAALDLAGPAIGDLVERVKGVVARAGSLDAAEAALARASAAQVTSADLVAAMRQAMLLAWLSGEAAEADKGGEGDVALQARKGFDPNQPRVPKGQPVGGEWTDEPAYGGDGLPGRQRQLAPRQLATLSGYTAADHRSVNWWLRHGELVLGAELDTVMRRAAEMDDALAGFRLREALTVYRGIDPTGAQRLAEIGLRKGTVLVDKGFMSTSRNLNVARWFARYDQGITMRIAAPKGAHGLDVAAISASPFTEQEVIFARGRRLGVVGWNRKTRILDVEMEP